MEKIRVSKVEDVTLWRRGARIEGTIHLMPHHIVFRYLPPLPPGSSPPTMTPRPKEVWITYPMINYCIYRPTPPASHQAPSIRLRCRDFTFFAFHFQADALAREVYDTIRQLSCKIGRLDKLLAFSYQPGPPEEKINGWDIYDPRREWKRLGISPKDSEKGWRITEMNKDYKYSPTYPALLVVPTKVSDNVLNYAANYRSRARIPALVYRHPINNCSITRSSQPMPGFRGNRSPQDEKLVAAIFATNSGWKTSPSNTQVAIGFSPDSSVVNLTESTANESFVGVGDAYAVNSGKITAEDLENSETEHEPDGPKIYGAQQRNMIVDARPTVNAMAMQAVGLGSERMEYYPGAEKAYLGIDNIHVMRRSLEKVIDALKDTDLTSFAPGREALTRSGWLKHISNVLDGTHLIVRTIGIMHSHVLIHCSDGWDRTSQLSALSQLCLDPYYRTLEGFIVLVEKDWLSFGHMFRHRSGFLSSDKWFQIENERIDRNESPGGNPFENAIRGARGLFNRRNESAESLSQPPEAGATGELQSVTDTIPTDTAAPTSRPSNATIGAAEEHRITKVNEISPVFHQFLDATYQLMRQYPTRFEFNERFLRRLLYHLYSCQYGTFLFDNEKERVESRAAQRTRSVWSYFLSRKAEFLNPDFDAVVDDSVRGQERIVFPKKGEVRWWSEVFGRPDEEMNGAIRHGPSPPTSLTPQTSNFSNLNTPINGQSTPVRSGTSTPQPQPEPEDIVTGTETAEHATGAGSTVHPKPMPAASLPASGFSTHNLSGAASSLSQGFQENIAAGIASLGVSSTNQRSVSPVGGKVSAKEEMEVEMQ